MATKAQLIGQMQARLNQFNAALDQFRQGTTAIAAALPNADAIELAITLATTRRDVAALNDLVANLDVINAGFEAAVDSAHPDEERHQRDALLLQARQAERNLVAERARLQQVTTVGRQTQAFYDALGTHGLGDPDLLDNVRNNNVTPAREAAQAVVVAYGNDFNAAVASENAILAIQNQDQVAAAQGALQALEERLTAINEAKTAYDERVTEVKERLGEEPLNLANGCAEFQAMDAQAAALEALQTAAQAEFTRQETLLTAMATYGQGVTAFNAARGVANTATNHNALVTMAERIATGGYPEDDAIDEAIRVATQAKDTLEGQIEDLPAEVTLTEDAEAATQALEDASVADPNFLAAIDAALQVRLNERQRRVDVFTSQQAQLTALTAYANASKQAGRTPLNQGTINYAAAQEALNAAFNDHGHHTEAHTQQAIAAAQTAVDDFTVRVTAAAAAYTAYEAEATKAMAILRLNGPNDLNQPDRAQAIQARLAVLKTARDTAQNNLAALQTAQIAKLVERDTAVFNDKKGAIDNAEGEFDAALAEYNEIKAEAPPAADHEKRLAKAKTTLEEKRAAFVTAINAYKPIAVLITTELDRLNANDEADEIKKQYEDPLKKATEDLADPATATHSLSALYAKAEPLVNALATIALGDDVSGKTIQNHINDDVNTDPAQGRGRKALYDHLDAQEAQFQQAKTAYEAYKKEADAAVDALQDADVPDTDEPLQTLLADRHALEVAMDARIAERTIVINTLSPKVRSGIIDPLLAEIKRQDAAIIVLERQVFALKELVETGRLHSSDEYAAKQSELKTAREQRATLVQSLQIEISDTTQFGGVRELGQYQLSLQQNYAELARKKAELDYQLRLYHYFATQTDQALADLDTAKRDYDNKARDPNYRDTSEGRAQLREITAKKAAVSGFYGRAAQALNAADKFKMSIADQSTKLIDENAANLNKWPAATDAIKNTINNGPEGVIHKITENRDAAAGVDLASPKQQQEKLKSDVEKAQVALPPEPKDIHLKAATPVEDLYLSLFAQMKLKENSSDPKAKDILAKLKKGETIPAADRQSLTGSSLPTDLSQLDNKTIGSCTFTSKDGEALEGKVGNDFRLEITGDDTETICQVRTLSGGMKTPEVKLNEGVTEAIKLLQNIGCPVVCVTHLSHKGDRVQVIQQALNLNQVVAMGDKDSGSQAARMWKTYQVLINHKTVSVDKTADRYIDLLVKPDNRPLLDQFLDGVIEKGHCREREVVRGGQTHKGVIVYWEGGTHTEYTKQDLLYMADDPTQLPELKKILKAQALKNGLGDFNRDRHEIGLRKENRLDIFKHTVSLSR